ncbi:MAG: c-type cytochrome domain-containing protein [Limisphaerales bacterium]
MNPMVRATRRLEVFPPKPSPPALGSGLIVVLSVLTASAATPLPVADLERATPVDFESEVLPVLRQNCLACHNQTRAKADLVLETPATIARGGASGPSVVPGEPDRSLLFRSAAHRVDDLVMPPAGNKSNANNLSPGELALLRLWIAQGAQGEMRSGRTLAWQPIPDSWNVSYAVAVDRHAQIVACARANRVQLYDPRSGSSVGRLEDPELQGATQRDIVSAIAFSPTEDLVATAGFREVRLWRRINPVVHEWDLPRTRSGSGSGPDAGTRWVAASISDDRTLVGLVTATGDVELRRTDNGSVVAAWPSVTSTPATLALSPDASRLAVAGASGIVRVLPVSGEDREFQQPLGGSPSALAWFDRGRALATVQANGHTIQTWRLPDSRESAALVPGPVLAAHKTPITALTADGLGALVSASADGMALRWPLPGDAAPASVACEVGVLRLRSSPGNPQRVFASLASGGTAVLEFGENPKVIQTLRGDPRRTTAADEAEQDLELARVELSFAEKSRKEAESATEKATETLAKAREKKDSHAKDFAEKTTKLSEQREAETAALRERDEFAAQLQRAADELSAAEKEAAEARVAAEGAAEESANLRLAADHARRLAADLERIVQGFGDGSGEPSHAKAREAFEAARAGSDARRNAFEESRTRVAKALEELASKSFLAGQRKAVAERANADLPPRKKKAEETAAAAKKAADQLVPQVEKARITLEGGEKDVELAEQSIHRASKSVELAKSAEATARHRIEAAERLIQTNRASAEAARRLPHILSDPIPAGTTLITLDSKGACIDWDLASAAPTLAFEEAGSPVDLFALDEHSALVIRRDSVARVDFSPRWERVRTLGESSAPSFVPPADAARLVDRVNAIAFSPDGKLLATGGGEPSRSGEIKLWNVTDGTLLRDLGSVHSDCVLALAFSPRGEFLASGGADRFARISEVADGRLLRNLEGHSHHVMAVAWLAHGGVLASAGAEGVVKIWNAHTGERLKNVDGFGKEVTGLRAVGSTAQFVAVGGGGQGRVIRENGEKVRDLPGTQAYLLGLATPRDGHWAAVAADDGVLRIWDLSEGKELQALAPR